MILVRSEVYMNESVYTYDYMVMLDCRFNVPLQLIEQFSHATKKVPFGPRCARERCFWVFALKVSALHHYFQRGL